MSVCKGEAVESNVTDERRSEPLRVELGCGCESEAKQTLMCRNEMKEHKETSKNIPKRSLCLS